MENRPTHNLTNPEVWIRLVYMLVFWLLLVVARFAIGVLALLQFILVLLGGADNRNLARIGESISQWVLQTLRFLTFNSEDKPFPFQDWPTAEEAGSGGPSLPSGPTVASAHAESDTASVTTGQNPDRSAEQFASDDDERRA